jgi:hypothetical protein
MPIILSVADRSYGSNITPRRFSLSHSEHAPKWRGQKETIVTKFDTEAQNMNAVIICFEERAHKFHHLITSSVH